MLDNIENKLRKEGRKQRGKKKLMSRKNIVPVQDGINIFVKKDMLMTLELFKILKLDLTKLFPSSEYLFKVLPNKTFSKKGILVRMGKGKGKLDTFGCFLTRGTIIIFIRNPKGDKDIRVLNSFFKKYPFLGFKI